MDFKPVYQDLVYQGHKVSSYDLRKILKPTNRIQNTSLNTFLKLPRFPLAPLESNAIIILGDYIVQAKVLH